MSSAAPYPKTTKEWLAKLVSFDTSVGKSNLPLIDYVEAYLQSLGISSVRVYNEDKTKANLFSTLPAADGSTTGGIILSGHTDVVSVAGQQWDSDPFVLMEKDGKLYGRGASDMKGFIAVVLAQAPEMLALPKTKPIYFSFSFDEETGCEGIPYLIRYLKQNNITADCCLVGEGTKLKVVTGNKGLCVWTVKVFGKAIHSSLALMNTSCNAIEWAAIIIAEIRRMALEIRATEKPNPHYLCPFSCISTGLIKGGNAVNTVPAECEFTFSLRVTEYALMQKIEDKVRQFIDTKVLPEMKKEYAGAKVTIEKGASMPPFNADEDAPFTLKMRELLNDHGQIRKSAGGTEAGFFQELMNIPTVIAGPRGGKTHEANEYQLISQLEECERMLRKVVPLYSGANGGSKL